VKLLVVGGGGREHALCWRLAQSPSVDRLFAAPGNAGMAGLATLAPVPASDVAGLVAFAERETIDLTVVGPEAPLAAGLVDELESRGLAAFGPTADGARIEGSKAWARELCDRHGIPAPRSRRFEEVPPALEYLDALDDGPYVVKADGLAAGKGVTVAETRAEARRALEDCLLHGVFGEAGKTVLVEEYLDGWEVSAMALTDGRAVVPMSLAHDYKRLGEGDAGPNTGGMGAFSPLPPVDPRTEWSILRDALQPAVRAMEEEGVRYRGVLYAGLMMTSTGPKVLEFNCRFGDPETQVVLPRLQADLYQVLVACREGHLGERRLEWSADACVGVVLASEGYPGDIETGRPVTGLEDAASMDGVMVFHAGTAMRQDTVVTSGGRVLTVCGLGTDLDAARARAYRACDAIRFEGKAFRRDIAVLRGDEMPAPAIESNGTRGAP
jgi:phosphoribosylamine--glycine ligase